MDQFCSVTLEENNKQRTEAGLKKVDFSPPVITQGTAVLLKDLKSIELNGVKGTATGEFDEATMRWVVKLDKGKVVKVKRENFSLLIS